MTKNINSPAFVGSPALLSSKEKQEGCKTITTSKSCSNQRTHSGDLAWGYGKKHQAFVVFSLFFRRKKHRFSKNQHHLYKSSKNTHLI